MSKLAFTEDRNEMIAMAKVIAEEKKEKYSGGLMKMIRESVKRRLPGADEKEIDDQVYLTIYHYWAYGASFDEYYYYKFAEKTHEEKLKYMTFQPRMMYGQHLNEFDKAHLLMNKNETYQYFREEFRRDMILCSSEQDFDAFLDFTDKHPEFVVKPTDMGGGRGVHKSNVAGMDEVEKKAFFLSLLTEGTENRSKYLRGSQTSVVLEELIDQDDSIAVFNPESVNGVRVNTILRNGDVMIYEPWLKIGRGGNFLTSAVFGTMDAGIDAGTGIVDTDGYTETGEIWTHHPDNQIRIKGFQVPKWDELVEMAKQCALRMPFFTYIAWDFALSKKGWCIMEGNYCGDFMWQLYREKGMKAEFEELVGWKLDKEFWWQD